MTHDNIDKQASNAQCVNDGLRPSTEEQLAQATINDGSSANSSKSLNQSLTSLATLFSGISGEETFKGLAIGHSISSTVLAQATEFDIALKNAKMETERLRLEKELECRRADNLRAEAELRLDAGLRQ